MGPNQIYDFYQNQAPQGFNNSGIQLHEIAVVCFGTGFMANWVASDTEKWGAAQWEHGDDNPFNRLPVLIINGKPSPILNALLNGTSTALIPQLSALMLGGTQATPMQSPRYAYVNPTLDQIIAENDVSASAITYMIDQVNSYDLSQAQNVLANNWPSTAAPASA